MSRNCSYIDVCRNKDMFCSMCTKNTHAEVHARNWLHHKDIDAGSLPAL